MAHTKARAAFAAKRSWAETDQWAAPEGSGASVESSESRPPYDEFDADPMFREPWPMPGELENHQ